MLIKDRFRGFLPVIIDVETGGFNAGTDALLQVAAVQLKMDDKGRLEIIDSNQVNIRPFKDAIIEPKAVEFNKLDPFDESRDLVDEKEALTQLFQPIRAQVKAEQCTRAVMVAHNAHFDLGFINAATARQGMKRNPFHPFSCFDTATLSGLVYGQTVLVKGCEAAGIEFNNDNAHNALYDAEKTAELFCKIVNTWQELNN